MRIYDGFSNTIHKGEWGRHSNRGFIGGDEGSRI